MRVTLVNPNLIVQKNDPFTTGIVYMPISLAYLAAALRTAGHEVNVVDAYASAPRSAKNQGQFSFFGLTEQEILSRIPEDAEVIFVYAINLTNHLSTISIVQSTKNARPDAIVVVVENTQAVTAYALSQVAGEFYDAGADYILTGESERRAATLLDVLKSKDIQEISSMDGIGSRDFYNLPVSVMPQEELDRLPLPAWDLFPLEGYWSLGFAHGPLSARRYLPLLTSRGCPYPCGFCVVPATNGQKWRARSAKNVVDEIEFLVKTFDVREFHIEDLDPTILDGRVRDICNEIIDRQLKIAWKIVAGTKVETLRDEETIDLMAKAGCTYISISPETGSPRVLKLMRKPFNLEHAVRIVKQMSISGIRSQACFVLGYPGENDEDRAMTRRLVHDLTKVGVDEIALFVVTPVPGSAIYKEFSGYNSLSELNFSPMWRKDYRLLSQFRLRLYASFLFWKLLHHPLKLLQQPLNFVRRRFQTKMEMVPYRALVLRWLSR